jgi:predicted  nucleic acid-binding Zn-ribbon protein
MICTKCGKEYADDVKFCTECGAELTAEIKAEEVTEAVAEEVVAEEAEAVAEESAAVVEEAVEEAVKEAEAEVTEQAAEAVADAATEKKASKLGDKSNSKFTKIGLAIVAIILLIFIPAVALGSDDESYMKNAEKVLLQITERDGDLYAIYLNDKEVELDDEKAYSQTYSMDGSVVCYKNEEDELVILKEGKVIKTGIDEAAGLLVSQRGDTLVYFTDCENATYKNTTYGYEDRIKVGTLNLYDIKKKSSVEIEEEVVVGSAVLSPDGKTVAYVAEYDATDDFKGFYSVNGKEPVEVGKEKRVFAISDKAKYVYYTDVDRIYVMKKNKEEKLANDVRYVEVLMNADNSEMLFFNEDKTYITVKGGEKKKVAGDELNTVILGDDAAYFEQELRKESGDITVSYTGVDTFEGKLFYSDATDEIFYMMKKFDTEKIASSAYQYKLSDDGESLVYNNYAEIVKVTKFNKGGEKQTLFGGMFVDAMYTDGDLKHIYFTNLEDELYYVKKGEEKKIADDVTSVKVSADGAYCYYVVDKEDLCYSKNGGKEKEILTVDDGTASCTKQGGYVFVMVSEDDTKTLYRMEGKKMKTVYVHEEESVSDYIDDILGDYSDYLD